jgi:lipopolysaccharide/colanic/teichoic acid biosynthesis glycosyltransferase
MSLVGPRPCTPYEFEHYEVWQRKRFNVRPGLTGLWQVSGKNKTTFRQMILLDLYYAMHARPSLDCQIMLRTFRVLVSQVEETHGPIGTQPAAFPPALKNERLPAA